MGHETFHMLLKPYKKIGAFRVTGLKILGTVGTHLFFYFFFSGKNIILCFSKCITFFSRKPEKKSRFHQQVTKISLLHL